MYLVAGGSGYLGRYIIKNILELTTEDIIATYSSNKPEYSNKRLQWKQIDIQNRDDIDGLCKLLDKDIKVVYLCAYHNPDKVKENPSLAWDINITSLAYFINKLQGFRCFYYSSTDTVYGEGSIDKAFREDDKTNPVNLYGKHKVLAELITTAHGGNVVRFPFIIGPSLVETKKHFYDRIIDDLTNNQEIEMFEDSYRSTLSFNQCACFLIELIEKYGSSVDKFINIAGDSAMSKYDVALKICERFNFNKKLVKPVSVKDNSGIFKEKRAQSAILDNKKLKQLLNLDKIELEL